MSRHLSIGSADQMGATASDGTLTSDGLRVEGLTVRYGGNTAVSDLALRAPGNRATALIGPNGAGKTTIFNACTGLLRPSAGRVYLFEEEITHLSPAKRARRGLGRTFQQMELCEHLTVADNVRLGKEARLAGGNPLRQLFSSSNERASVSEALESALELCGLIRLRHRLAGTLSTGQRRMVELARAVAAGFELLMLDEPSSGLDKYETERFGAILQQVQREQGIGLILVEHDIALVRAVCDYVYVIDFGRLISDGRTSEVLSSDVVRAAYLGSAAAERGPAC